LNSFFLNAYFFFADGFIANVGLSNVIRKRAAVSEARPPLDPEEADEYGSGLMFSREGHYQEAVFLASSLAASTQVMTRLIEAEAELNPSPAAFRALRDCGQDPDMLLEGLRDKRKELLISQQQLFAIREPQSPGNLGYNYLSSLGRLRR
jgi:hypothetical protein